MQYQIKTVKEIKHLIPNDSEYAGYCQFYSYAHTFYENRYVVVVQGDWHPKSTVNLDNISTHFPDYHYQELDVPAFILVQGNVVVSNLFNQRNEGACGLIVLGNLSTENIAVSGQELYVQGNLFVEGFFLGDTAIGKLTVKKALDIRVFIETEYVYPLERFETADEVTVSYWLKKDDPDRFKKNHLLKSLLPKTFLYTKKEVEKEKIELWNWSAWLKCNKLFEALEKGSTILYEEEQIEEKILNNDGFTFLFKSTDINLENLQRFINPEDFALLENNDDKTGRYYEYWEGEIFYRITLSKINPAIGGVYFYCNERVFYLFTDGEKLHISWQPNEASPFVYLEAHKNPREYYFVQECWQYFQRRYSEVVHYVRLFRDNVTVERYNQLLSLPEVQKYYSDYTDVDAVLYIGRYGFQFRKAESNTPSRMTITKEYWDDKLCDYQFVFYHYEPNKEGTAINLFTQDGNGYEFSTYKVDAQHSKFYKLATAIFKRAERVLLTDEFLTEREASAREMDEIRKPKSVFKRLAENIGAFFSRRRK